MARLENPPFARGQTFYQGATIDSNNLGGTDLEGEEWEFEDMNWGSSTVTKRTGRRVLCRIVRNVGAAALLGKRIVSFQLTAGSPSQGRIDGYATTTAAPGRPLDEFLPTAGLPVNDLGWVVMRGPAVIKKALSNTSADFAVGDSLVNITGATSNSTTSGRLAAQDLTGATALLGAQIQNRIGRAMSTALTNDTGADVLVDVGTY